MIKVLESRWWIYDYGSNCTTPSNERTITEQRCSTRSDECVIIDHILRSTSADCMNVDQSVRMQVMNVWLWINFYDSKYWKYDYWSNCNTLRDECNSVIDRSVRFQMTRIWLLIKSVRLQIWVYDYWLGCTAPINENMINQKCSIPGHNCMIIDQIARLQVMNVWLLINTFEST